MLPSDITYGYVTGRYLLAVADTTGDPDRNPDSTPAVGSVRFTPVQTMLLSQAVPPTTVLPQPVVVTLDASGALADQTGAPGVWLVAGQYDVAFSFAGVTVPGFRIDVTDQHTVLAPLDLTLAAPLVPSPATVFVVNQQIYNDVLAVKADIEEQLQYVEGGMNGDSAYELAVKNGFTGTEAEWLASLEGQDGTPGKSAYQVAVDNGFVGTEAEWLESLGGSGDGGGGSVETIAPGTLHVQIWDGVGTQPLRDTTRTDVPVEWRQPVAPPSGNGYAIPGVDTWLVTP